MRRLLRMSAVLASVVILLPSCGSGAAAFPTGDWTATNADNGQPGVMEFRSDGSWTFTAGGTPVSTGTYSADQATITFKTDSWCKTKDAEVGVYTWTHTGDQLTMAKKDDACADRIGVVDGRVWTAAP